MINHQQLKKIALFKLLTVFCITLFASTLSYADVSVSGYYRSNGTYVKPHKRSYPDGIHKNNYSAYGNKNPYTGKKGYTKPPKPYKKPKSTSVYKPYYSYKYK